MKNTARFVLLLWLSSSVFLGCGLYRAAREEASGPRSQDGVATFIQDAKETVEAVDSYIPYGAVINGLLGLAGIGWSGYRALQNGKTAEALGVAVGRIGKAIEGDPDGGLSSEDAKRIVKEVAREYGVKKYTDKIYNAIKKKGLI